MEKRKHIHVRTLLNKVEYKMLKEMRYAKPCDVIISGVESSTSINMCNLEFYSCNM